MRNYFGCDSIDGAELEDGGSSGTAGSHWEKRLFNNECINSFSVTSSFFIAQNRDMTGSASVNPVFSGLTLSLLEDSGWYRVNYSVADPLFWGRGQGCNFVAQACSTWDPSKGYTFFFF